MTVQTLRYRLAQFVKGFVFVAATGDEAAFTVFDVGERTESIKLDFFCGVRCYVALHREPMIQMRRTDSDAT